MREKYLLLLLWSFLFVSLSMNEGCTGMLDSSELLLWLENPHITGPLFIMKDLPSIVTRRCCSCPASFEDRTQVGSFGTQFIRYTRMKFRFREEQCEKTGPRPHGIRDLVRWWGSSGWSFVLSPVAMCTRQHEDKVRRVSFKQDFLSPRRELNCLIFSLKFFFLNYIWWSLF